MFTSRNGAYKSGYLLAVLQSEVSWCIQEIWVTEIHYLTIYKDSCCITLLRYCIDISLDIRFFMLMYMKSSSRLVHTSYYVILIRYEDRYNKNLQGY